MSTARRSPPAPPRRRPPGAAARRRVRWLATALAAAGWLHLLLGPEGLAEQRRRAASVARLAEVHAHEIAANRALEEEVRRLASDPLAIERAVRIELGYTRPGEIVYLLDAPALLDPEPLAPEFDTAGGGS